MRANGGNGWPALIDEAQEVALKRRSRRHDPRDDSLDRAQSSLRQRVGVALSEAEQLLEHSFHLERAASGFDGAAGRLRRALSLIRDTLGGPSLRSDTRRARQLVACTVELEELHEEVCERQVEQRLAALGNIRRALGSFEGVESVSRVKDAGTRELCRFCGFDRAMFFRRAGPELLAEALTFADDPDWGAAVRELADRARPRLDKGIREGEALRHRRSVLIPDAWHDRHTYRPLVAATDTRAYVAAPVMAGTRR